MKNAKVLSALGLMSLASTAALAASSGPTLGSVLDASGLKVSGAVAASFRQNASVQGAQAQSDFEVDQALLSIAYQPKEGFGAVVDVATGLSNSSLGGLNYYSAATNTVALTQAFVQYKSGALTVQGGRFYTAAGYEVFPVTGNLFVTRSQTFGLESTYHTGVRASYAVSDALTVNAGVNNGIFVSPSMAGDTNYSTLKNKAFELGASYAVSSDLSLALTGYMGKNGAGDKQSLYSLVATYSLNKDISFAVNVDQGNGDNTDATKYTAIALYGSYAVNDKVKVGLRLEDINPKLSSANGTGSVTGVVSYAAAKNFDLRTELSDIDEEGSEPRVMQAAIQGVLKF